MKIFSDVMKSTVVTS